MSPHRHSAVAEHSAASPVHAFLRQPSLVDFPDEHAAVFFISGCNFRCGFCHNAGLLAERQEGVPWGVLRKACRAFAGDWVGGAVISGGEPTLHEELPDLVDFLKSEGFRVKLDTNGSRPEVLAPLLSKLDYVAMDVKAPLADYPALTGFEETERIAESIALIRDAAEDHEFRTTVIESFHTAERMGAIADLIRGARRYVLQPFVPRAQVLSSAYRTQSRTSPAHLRAMADRIGGCAQDVVLRGARLV